MQNRKRNLQLKIYLTTEEKELFEKKMKLTHAKTMSQFIRKCVLEKTIYEVDLHPFLELSCQISKVGNNINQIAMKANTTKTVSNEDIAELKQLIKHIQKQSRLTHDLLLKRVKEASQS